MALADILGGPIKGIIDSTWSIIDKFVTTPEEKQKLEMAKLQQQLAIDQALREHEVKVLEIAGANIRAETTSDDNYTRRMRPTFGYMICAILACNYILFPTFGKSPLLLPDALLWLFGSYMLGYTSARTWEKFTAAKLEK
jgi:hypothetical protein